MTDSFIDRTKARLRGMLAGGGSVADAPPYAIDDLFSVADALAGSSDYDARMQALCRASARMCGAHRGTILMRHQGSYQRSFSAGPAGTPAMDRAPPVLDTNDPVVERLMAAAGAQVFTDNSTIERLSVGGAPAGSVVGQGIKASDGKPVGLLLLEFPQQRPGLVPAQNEILAGIARLAASLQRGHVRTLALEETALREQDATLERTDAIRADAMADLAQGLGHELHSLVTLIGGYAELLAEIEQPPMARLYLERLKHGLARTATLGGDLLGIAGHSDLDPPAVDLNLAIETLLPELERRMPADVAIEFQPGRGVAIKLDRELVDGMLRTLTALAREAMPGGGRLSIQTDGLWLSEAQSKEYPGLGVGDYVKLAVSDTGDGIDSQLLTRVFEPFSGLAVAGDAGRGRSRATGGMRLAALRGRVRSAGGDIRIHSGTGVGTTWELLLPRAQGTAATPAPNVLPARISGSETLLLCDDDDAMLELMSECLRTRGYRVLAARGADAAEALALRQPGLDLLVTDLVMPASTGAELHHRLQLQFPSLPVLYTSGHSAAHGMYRTMLPPDALLLATPYTPEQLARHVRHALNLSQGTS